MKIEKRSNHFLSGRFCRRCRRGTVCLAGVLLFILVRVKGKNAAEHISYFFVCEKKFSCQMENKR